MPFVSEDINKYIDNGALVLPESLIDYPESIILSDNFNIVTLGNLRSINGGLYIWNCENLVSLGDLSVVRGPIDCALCPNLVEASNLTNVVGYAQLSDSKITHLNSRFKVEKIAPNIKASAYLPNTHPYKLAM